MKAIIPFSFAGVAISKDADGRVSLTDLWKAAGSNPDKRPNDWLNYDHTKAFIDGAAAILNTAQNGIINSKKGRNGGTFAHKQIALAYAKYLSPELHLTVNQVFFERIEEEKNPQLAIDRGVASWKRKGKDEAWINERLMSTATRNSFTSVLAQHGVTPAGFGHCTNAIYTPLFGGGAEKVREKKNLPVKTNTREHMSLMELTATRFAELLAAENIENKQLRGNKECEYECLNSANLVAKTILQSRKNHKLAA